ncbi:beta-3-deoxy-D-manno-oct-2-ulosonic acid transferase [Sphingobium sp. JS3065]|uniref:capsular polysaccharide export protein, LipB/KpsS family n=1 Tax=Sphingobium sp. JS3065 TaxID=2970925 RepID=UPI0022640627|nr:beta-3-deoxy-D-manno-oct-2-ulosonic acid transferase [Sphingobium sp. JS3065]UZW54283.1 beta-3-deoxy-D-manno-oct-2-ulosonic acid transferase [Sphingobium sp. JS3065]
MNAPAFLRSPPFPGIKSATAAISHARQTGDAPVAVTDAVLDAIADARVGGAFWGHRPEGIRLVARAGIAVPPEALDGLSPQEIGIVGGGRHGNGVARRDLPWPADLWTVIAGARSVHAAADDELAIVAGLLGVPVYGPDLRPVAAETLREAARSAVAAARYRDCFSGEPVDVLHAVAQLSDWRRHLDGNHGIAAASGMAFWKREAIRHFLWDGVCSPPFLSAEKGLRLAVRRGGALAVWPSRVSSAAMDEARRQGVTVAKVEDGFLRSKGLGAALHPPGSVVVDRSGIYYDARFPSDMEKLLATHGFTPALEQRAARLRAMIRASGVTKYGKDMGQMIALPQGRRTILAVGQVEDDLSVEYGGAGVTGNLDLLKRVRAAEPDAFIVYRPHPDVQAGLRKGHLSDAAVLEQADAIDTGSPLMDLVQAVDEVHVLSSLTGFEALMRDRPVTVHGMPFYAGWGLTRDLAAPNGRRGRQLTLDQLVAGALILYPRYLDPVTRLPCGPEIMVERLASGAPSSMSWPVSWLIRLRTLQGKLQRFMTLSAEYFHG